MIALQEVDAGPGPGNQAEQLLSPLGYEVAYEPRVGDNVADPGIAVAARHPITDRRLIELPHGGAAIAARPAVSSRPVAGRGRAWGRG